MDELQVEVVGQGPRVVFVHGSVGNAETTWSQQRPLEDRFAYDGSDLLDAWSHMHADFLRRGWSDGFPLVPATPRAVEAMLRGTPRRDG